MLFIDCLPYQPINIFLWNQMKTKTKTLHWITCGGCSQTSLIIWILMTLIGIKPREPRGVTFNLSPHHILLLRQPACWCTSSCIDPLSPDHCFRINLWSDVWALTRLLPWGQWFIQSKSIKTVDGTPLI